MSRRAPTIHAGAITGLQKAVTAGRFPAPAAGPFGKFRFSRIKSQIYTSCKMQAPPGRAIGKASVRGTKGEGARPGSPGADAGLPSRTTRTKRFTVHGAGAVFAAARAWRAGVAVFAIASAFGCALLYTATMATAAELRVDVTGLRSGGGEVHLAVFATPATFPRSDAMLAEAIVRAKAAGVHWVFSGLKPGTYALAVYHDENENREFDRGFLGIPLEGFGFSNDAQVFFGPPDFADAAVTVPGKGVRITIRMIY